ncbi:MarR family transcriptional regulator [Comamonas sp. JUb58]|uniref:helix-turn-helix transcriptional regulator n=1 Tax=Comamonas sp. JUb58 TaxID=2485114 RepID=UPI0010617913|nr:MarR family transcriptional regulator [Comamonas sp. JUb58]
MPSLPIDPSATMRMLEALKRQAPASTADLARALQMTAEAARQQINKLADQGLVQADLQKPAGAGRPRQLWTLTAAGQRYFPDAHAQLTVQLIGAIEKLFGQQGMDGLISEREAQSRSRYRQACTAPGLPERLAQLAEVRTQEGYMAHVEPHPQGWLLVEHHCPICAAAQSCRGFCRSEQALFQEVVEGLATLERSEYLLEGGQRCVYLVQPL